jgi:hypothetical protein
VGYDMECFHVERNGVGLVVGTDYIVVYDDDKNSKQLKIFFNIKKLLTPTLVSLGTLEKEWSESRSIKIDRKK